MTIQELLAAVGLPPATEVADGDPTLVDSLRDLVGHTSQGHLPEVEAVAVLDARLGGGETEGYLFTTHHDNGTDAGVAEATITVPLRVIPAS